MLWLIVKIAAAAAAIVVLYVLGAGMVRSFNGEPPFSQPPEPGELQPVDFRYRCIVCGALVTMTAAPPAGFPHTGKRGGKPPAVGLRRCNTRHCVARMKPSVMSPRPPYR